MHKAFISATATLLATTMASGSLAATPAIQRNYQVTTDRTTLPGALIYRPTDLKAAGKLPVIVTGIAGNCSPESPPTVAETAAGSFHIPVAAKGFLILAVGKINPNAVMPGPRPPAAPGAAPAAPPPAAAQPARPGNMTGWEPWKVALDALAANSRNPASPYYNRLDLEKVGAWGISCGGINAMNLAGADPRVKSIFGWTTATSPGGTDESARAMLNKIAPRPMIIHVGGPVDIARKPANRDYLQVPANMPFYLAEHASYDHVGIGSHVDAAGMVNWFDMTLNHQPAAKDYFFGKTYGQCKGASPCDWTVKWKNWDGYK